MEGPDSKAQLPLPSIAPISGAQIIALPIQRRSVSAHPPASSNSPDTGLQTAAKSTKPKRPKSNNLWYALYLPQFKDLDPARQKKYLDQLAKLMLSVSSSVSLHPQAVVCEIRSSLKYFDGIDAIHQKLQKLIEEQLQQWGLLDEFLYAASPTVSGSLLLARSGHNALVYQKQNLASILGRLSTDVLNLDKQQQRRLHSMGVRYLRDIWRLPSDGVYKRFGRNFVNQLQKALGKAAEPTHNYTPAPVFTTSYDLPYELENLDRLLPMVDKMLAQLCDFLRRRDLSTSHLVFYLFHEKCVPTEINIGLRQASRSQQHLMLLLETHFDKLSIPAPVIAIKIDVKKFDAFFAKSDSLLETAAPEVTDYNDSNFIQFIEKLQARLGDSHIKSVIDIEQHCPEHASIHFDYAETSDKRIRIAKNKNVAKSPRPLWLLKNPVQLNINKGRLFYRRPITIVSGPERIETHWWSGVDVRRDYYVAQERKGSRLWIYRDRSEEKGGDKNWYLHGFFA